MPELQTILQNKDRLILQAQEQLTQFLFEQGNKFSNDLARIIGSGNFTQADIIQELTRLGYDDAVTTAMENWGKVIDLSREASGAMGINFLLTEQNEANLIEFLQQKQRFIQLGIKERIANDMYDFAIGARMGQRPVAQIKSEAAILLENQFRRVGTEVETALTAFDRAVDQAVFENVGIERFVYFPGTLIETSRESCTRIVNDPRQQTGWTREEIDAEPDVDFVLGGWPFWNCRHRWIPFDVDV